MCKRSSGFVVLVVLLAAVVVGEPTGVTRAATPPSGLPSWPDVEKALDVYFQSLPNFQPGGLIVQSEADGAIRQLAKHGWQVADAKQIVAQVPSDSGFLAVTLRSPAGREFAKSISGYTDGYDRLDRLSRLPRGEQMVRDLVRGPGGYELIKYMTTAPGGRVLGQQLSRAPKGANFNQPTHRIYTAEMLKDRLKECYEKLANGSVGPK